jgi:hypothetical protein
MVSKRGKCKKAMGFASSLCLCELYNAVSDSPLNSVDAVSISIVITLRFEVLGKNLSHLFSDLQNRKIQDVLCVIGVYDSRG